MSTKNPLVIILLAISATFQANADSHPVENRILTTSSTTKFKQYPLKINIDMVVIKGGCFNMGSPLSEPQRSPDEHLHEVCVDDFEIGKYEVTQAQWREVMGEESFSIVKGEKLPVVRVSWDDVSVFIIRLNEKTGQHYRLPTEAEWEYAARAASNTPFYTGACISTDQANYQGMFDDYNKCGAKTGKWREEIQPVGSYPPNAWGLFDIAGNVWEWTCSGYEEEYRSGKEKKCRDQFFDVSYPVIRGGSYYSNPDEVRSANRHVYAANSTWDDVGFRLVISKPNGQSKK